jgi:hypothetical protein
MPNLSTQACNSAQARHFQIWHNIPCSLGFSFHSLGLVDVSTVVKIFIVSSVILIDGFGGRTEAHRSFNDLAPAIYVLADPFKNTGVLSKTGPQEFT